MRKFYLLGAVLLCTTLVLAGTLPAGQVGNAAKDIRSSQQTALTPDQAGIPSGQAAPSVPVAIEKKEATVAMKPAAHKSNAVLFSNGVVGKGGNGRGLTCPTGSLFSQPSYPASDTNWSAATSDMGPAEQYKIYEDFSCVSGEICDVHWWGLTLSYSSTAGWAACIENPMTFEIAFYQAGTTPGALVATYSVTVSGVATGESYAGYPSYEYSATLSPCVTGLINGWISIQGTSVGTPTDCWFLWMSGYGANGHSLQWSGTAMTDYAYDNALCLTGNYVAITGACCDDATGVCNSNVAMIDCCAPGLRFTANTLCENIVPQCGQILGACCNLLDCIGDYTEFDCGAAGGTQWTEGATCATYACNAYCPICWTNITDDWITNVTFNTINNTTGQNGSCSYGDYGAISTTVLPGSTYALSVSFYSAGYTECVTAWFDWNRNGVWEVTEKYDLGCGADATLTANITVPADAAVGAMRMRVTEKYYSAATDPCVGGSYGETEDYGVIVGDPLGACCDDITGVCDYRAYSTCTAGRFVAGVQCVDLDPVCGGVTGACCVGTTCTVELPANCTGYYLGDFTTCNNSPCSGACCNLLDCIGDYNEADCTAAGGMQWTQGATCATHVCAAYCPICWTNITDDWITNVTFNTINNTSGQNGACSYGDYTALSTNVSPGSTYLLSVTFYSAGYTECVTAWFDWNRNGVWEVTEKYNLGCGADTTLTMNITVPAGASNGVMWMRVTEKYSSAATDPCLGGSYGETEDYAVMVGEVPGACCYASGTCNSQLPGNCATLGGTYGGPNTVCAAADCNANGVDDFCDILAGTSLDCNADGIPDECQLVGHDCNTNGIPDECELVNNDCNENGIPDECELSGNDCNTNLIPDDCEEDCNTNGIPDDCDIASAFSLDCNSNGIPDECELGLLRTPGFLTTTFAGGNGYNGNMFDLTILNPQGLTIASFDGNFDGTAANVEVWYRGDFGSYVGHNLSADGWVLLGSLTGIPTNAAGTPTPVAIGGLYLPAGVTCGIYFTRADTGTLTYTNGPLGAFQNADVRFENYGHGGAYPFNLGNTPRIWNGTIYYDTGHGGGGDCNTNGIPDDCDVPPICTAGPPTCSLDCNGDLVPDECQLVDNDCNTNGIPDDCDIANATSLDCQPDGIPDECQMADNDCNTNGIPDDCDIANGTSQDCQPDGIPDECQLAGNDCQPNGIPDDCEADCNGNGIADECDIASGFSQDCNSNDIPDECELGSKGRGACDEVVYDAGVCDGADGSRPTVGWNDTGIVDKLVVPQGTNGLTFSCFHMEILDFAQTDMPNMRVRVYALPTGDILVDLPSFAAATALFDYTYTVASGELFITPRAACYVGALAWDYDGTGPSYTFAAGAYAVLVNFPGSGAVNYWASAADEGMGFGYIWGAQVDAPSDAGMPFAWKLLGGPVGTDCNTNGVLDECDVPPICSDPWPACSLDCNGDLVPDECQLVDNDCNTNGIPDDCDIALGTSLDCNHDGIPDECQMYHNDCNANGILDDCDIASGYSQDCNTNGVPDECDITAGDSVDCNTNGVPDECEVVALPGPTLLSEGFEDITTLPPQWVMTNLSNPLGTSSWFQGTTAFSAQAGSPTSFIAANYQNTTTGTISDWLITPVLNLNNGLVLSFYTRTPTDSTWADRLEVRMSTNGPSADVGTTEFSVGDFTTLLVSVNPDLVPTGYPQVWEPDGHFTVTISGLSGATAGRLAFRYFVTDGGGGANSNYIGIDTVTVQAPDVPPASDCNNNNVPDECDIPPICTDPYPACSLDTNANGIPDECEAVCLGDSNCDGVVSWRDIDFFVAAMSGPTSWVSMFSVTPTCTYWNNDVNGDGVVTWRDIDPFVAVMGQVCP